MQSMTGQERVNRWLERREQDRIPRCETLWPETVRRWQGEGLDGDAETVMALLGSDFHLVSRCFPPPFPGQWREIGGDDATVTAVNSYGATVRVLRDGSGTPEHVGFDCDTPEKWRTLYKPALLAVPPTVKLDAARQRIAEGRRLGRWLHMHGGETFEFARQIIGDETAMIAMVEDPEWIVDISRTITDVMLRNYDHLWDSGLRFDGVWMYGDMAYKNATLCSPAMYRDLVWPDHRRLAQWAHDRGLKFIFHTDGNVNGVIDLYLRAGFDALQPLEAKAGMDLHTLVPRWGDRLAFFGNVDVMILAGNDRPRIEHEVRGKLAAGMARQGYAYHSDHSVPPTVSWATYQFVIDLVKQYGNYARS